MFQEEESREKLQEFVNDRYSFYESKQVTSIQPFVIICGPLNDILSSHVVIGKIIYDCTTPVEAVDFCFKSFFALHIDYSLACPHLWSFFQKFVFEIKGYKSVTASHQISALCSELSLITE